MAKIKASKWIDRMIGSLGKHFDLETSDGVVRSGKITGFTYRTMKLNGDVVEFPAEIEVNGDPNDRIPLDRIDRLTIT
jgi:translation initiation factor IF-1